MKKSFLSISPKCMAFIPLFFISRTRAQTIPSSNEIVIAAKYLGIDLPGSKVSLVLGGAPGDKLYCARTLNEIEMARAVLLTMRKRGAYDFCDAAP